MTLEDYAENGYEAIITGEEPTEEYVHIVFNDSPEYLETHEDIIEELEE